MRKRICAVLAAVLCAALLAGCGGSYGAAMQANWGLTLPESKLVYETDSGPSFQGDGERCHVFACDAAELAAWQDAADLPVWVGKARELLDGLDVPAEQRPDWERCRAWCTVDPEDTRDQLILLWDESAGLLYVLEQFM